MQLMALLHQFQLVWEAVHAEHPGTAWRDAMVAVRVGTQGDNAVGCEDGEVLGCHYAECGHGGEASWSGSDHTARSVSSRLSPDIS